MVEKNLDFRSDTFTFPTPEMRESAMKAPVGDDGYGEDPTVNKLERLAADMLGKESALFVTSGILGNNVCLLSHTKRGDEVILEARSDIYRSERGSIAFIGALMTKIIPGEQGWMRPKDIEAAIRPLNNPFPRTALICVENTHNEAGGIPLTPKQLEANWDVAKRHNLPVHMDGARIFNAAIALRINVKELAKCADSVMFCLSKGLAAPVGSVVVGTEELIDKARRYRKMLGGGMRQAGIIAAPGVLALTKMIDRLEEDHENAKLLANEISQIEGIKVLHTVMTNIVYIDISKLGWTSQQWNSACAKLGWKSGGYPRDFARAREESTTIRLCTHYGIEREDIESFLEGIKKLVPKN